MFRAVPCSSSGGQIVLLQPLVSSLSVNGRKVCLLRADCVESIQAYTMMHGHKNIKFYRKVYLNLLKPDLRSFTLLIFEVLIINFVNEGLLNIP